MRAPVAGTLGLAAALLLVPAGRPEGRGPRAPAVRLVSLVEGLRRIAPDRDLRGVGATEVGKLAASAGVDLLDPPNPLVAWAASPGRLFYVFYKSTEDAFGDRPYLVQRIKKTERAWDAPDDPEPEEKVTYQVEVFKTMAGALKQPDQHHGSYSLRGHWRREIVKEYEVGFGEVPSLGEGTGWPFPAGTLFKYLYRYGEDPKVYESTRFSAATRWTLVASLDAEGRWRVASPELAFDLPVRPPSPQAARPRPDPSSKDLVLLEGRGLEGLAIGDADAAALGERLGEPLEAVEVGKGHRNLSFPGAISANLDPAGRLNTLITRPGFLGRTSRGVSHGDPRTKVMETMGAPRGQYADADTWRYDGVLFAFDGFDRVERVVVFRR